MAFLDKYLALPWRSDESTHTIGGISDTRGFQCGCLWRDIKFFVCVEVYTRASLFYMHHLLNHFCMCKLSKFYWAVCVRTVSSAAPQSLTHSLTPLQTVCWDAWWKFTVCIAEGPVIMFEYDPFSSTVLGFLKLQVARDWVRATCVLNIHSQYCTVFGYFVTRWQNFRWGPGHTEDHFKSFPLLLVCSDSDWLQQGISRLLHLFLQSLPSPKVWLLLLVYWVCEWVFYDEVGRSTLRARSYWGVNVPLSGKLSPTGWRSWYKERTDTFSIGTGIQPSSPWLPVPASSHSLSFGPNSTVQVQLLSWLLRFSWTSNDGQWLV